VQGADQDEPRGGSILVALANSSDQSPKEPMFDLLPLNFIGPLIRSVQTGQRTIHA
jgi:hypothetical protein